jgi:hypothetical protein
MLSQLMTFDRLIAVLTILISNQALAIQHLVVSQDVENHLLVDLFRRILKADFHAAGFLFLEVNVAGRDVSSM